MTNNEINKKVADLRALEASIEALKATADSLKNDIKAELDAFCDDALDTGLYHIFYKPVAKKIVDTKKLKADGLYDNYSKESVSLYFSIKDVNDEE